MDSCRPNGGTGPSVCGNVVCVSDPARRASARATASCVGGAPKSVCDGVLLTAVTMFGWPCRRTAYSSSADVKARAATSDVVDTVSILTPSGTATVAGGSENRHQRCVSPRSSQPRSSSAATRSRPAPPIATLSSPRAARDRRSSSPLDPSARETLLLLSTPVDEGTASGADGKQPPISVLVVHDAPVARPASCPLASPRFDAEVLRHFRWSRSGSLSTAWPRVAARRQLVEALPEAGLRIRRFSPVAPASTYRCIVAPGAAGSPSGSDHRSWWHTPLKPRLARGVRRRPPHTAAASSAGTWNGHRSSKLDRHSASCAAVGRRSDRHARLARARVYEELDSRWPRMRRSSRAGSRRRSRRGRAVYVAPSSPAA